MNKSIFAAIVFLTIDLLASQTMRAQGTTYVSNLGQTPTGSAAVASDAWIAQTFLTGSNSSGYVLNSIQLLMGTASGNPSSFTVSLYSKSGDPGRFQIPGDTPQSVGSLTGSNPATGGLFTYTTSGFLLSPSAWYFVVVTAATPVAQGAYNWSAVNSSTIGSDGWKIDNSYFTSTNGSSWTFHPRENVFQLGINATAVPEPSSLVFLCFGGLLLGAHQFRHAKANKKV